MVYPESSARGLRLSACLLLALGFASAQTYPPGGYPPGGYPPGGYPPTYPGQYPYPGQRGPSIPIPTRGGKQSTKDKKKADDAQPLPNFRGKLKQMDDKSISLELGDNRVLDFKRTGKTKFYKAGEEVKTPKFNAGDQISVEGLEDQAGFFTAVNVYWERAAAAETANSPEKDKQEGVYDTWGKDSPGATDAKAASESKTASAAPAPPPSKPDPDDPGRPRLVRGKPADPSRERSAPVPAQTADATPPPPMVQRPVETASTAAPTIRRTGDEDAAPIKLRPMDEMIRRATDAALDFTETLPAYVCQEMIARYQSDTHPVNWQPLDVVSTDLVYENGKEDYRDIKVNGKPKKSLEDTGGAWSTGEFASVLIDLFSPATGADFHFQRESRIAGVNAKLYDFSVLREHSHWKVEMASQSYNPPYKGSVWIDPQTARVLRIEMQAYGFPDAFPTDHVESATDYQYVRLGDAKQYLLPVHAETLSCQRGTSVCSRNVIDFRNYHKYTGESSITFETPK